MTTRVVEPLAAVGRATLNAAASIGRGGLLAARVLGALRAVDIWGRLLLTQMARVGVESVPIALFIAVFTGIVLALLSSYSFTGAVPLYFVGTFVGKAMMLELAPEETTAAFNTPGAWTNQRSFKDPFTVQPAPQ